MSVIERIISTARQRGYTQVALAEALRDYHVTKQTITDWKAGKSNSYYALIPAVAGLLGVTSDYLLTGQSLPADEEALLCAYRQLSETGRHELMEFLNHLTQETEIREILSADGDAEKSETDLLPPEMRQKILELLEDEDD